MGKNRRGTTHVQGRALGTSSVVRTVKDRDSLPKDTLRARSICHRRLELHVKKTHRKVARDKVEPPLTKLYIEPTTRCNLECRTCIRNSWNEPFGSMDMNVYEKMLSELGEIHTLKSVAFWGIGEPLVHPEIIHMIALAHDMGLNTELITNGLLLDKDTAKGLIQAGLDTLVVSMDGTTQASYRGIRTGGDLLRLEENIRGLTSLRAQMSRKNPELGLEFVVMRSNIDELPGLAEKMRSMEASFLMVTNLLPCTEDMKEEILYWISAHAINDTEGLRWSDELMLPRMDSRSSCLAPLRDLLKRLGKPMPGIRDIPQEDYCPFIHKGSMAVSWSGDVSPCIPLMHSYRCYILGREKLIKRYSVGNAAEENIMGIWNKEDYRDFRDRVLSFHFSPCLKCGGCYLSETNEEDCLGNIHPVCGDCLWANGVLLCP